MCRISTDFEQSDLQIIPQNDLKNTSWLSIVNVLWVANYVKYTNRVRV